MARPVGLGAAGSGIRVAGAGTDADAAGTARRGRPTRNNLDDVIDYVVDLAHSKVSARCDARRAQLGRVRHRRRGAADGVRPAQAGVPERLAATAAARCRRGSPPTRSCSPARGGVRSTDPRSRCSYEVWWSVFMTDAPEEVQRLTHLGWCRSPSSTSWRRWHRWTLRPSVCRSYAPSSADVALPPGSTGLAPVRRAARRVPVMTRAARRGLRSAAAALPRPS